MSAPVDVPETFTCESCGDTDATPAFGRRICTACMEADSERPAEPNEPAWDDSDNPANRDDDTLSMRMDATTSDTKTVDVLADLRKIADGEGDAELLAMRAHAAITELMKAAKPLTSAAQDSGLMDDILSGLRPHEVASVRESIVQLDAALRACGGAQ